MDAGSPRQEVFEKIYRTRGWGGTSRSGPGSDTQHTASYVRFVNDWLEKHLFDNIQAEIGMPPGKIDKACGAPVAAPQFDDALAVWMIAENRNNYQSDRVRFECIDFLAHPPPSGDLLLIKDVLQHLSNANVQKFIDSVLRLFGYAIMTNDVRKYEECRRFGIWANRRELQTPNIDICDGGSRPVRLDAAPFELQVTEKSTYSVVIQDRARRVVFVKDILVWERGPSV